MVSKEKIGKSAIQDASSLKKRRSDICRTRMDFRLEAA